MALVDEAVDSGATRSSSCQLLGVSVRTIERWRKNPEVGDRRSGPLTQSVRALSAEEKKKMIDLSNSPPYRDLCPWNIVAKLADAGQYLASESSFYRVLKRADLLSHRSKNRPGQRKRPKELVARGPNCVWSWDISYMKGPIKGTYYYLYLIVDVFSRYIVAWSVEEVESADHAATLMARGCSEQKIEPKTLTLHSDNGGPMKGATMLATLQKLHVMPSFSRPSVSNDNPFSESLFKTLKYCPSYPDGSFAGIDDARTWVEKFVMWYNTEHLHSAIRFVTPLSRHEGKDREILKNRHIVYESAKLATPQRWSGKTRNWNMINEVVLNPEKEKKSDAGNLRNQAA